MAKIQIQEIDHKQFNVSHRSDDALGDVVLITPGFDKHKWENDELHLRSVLCRPDGRIISSGFPKFFNYGEKEDHDALTQQAILSGEVYFAEKMDGSLIIRSVIDGQVHFRTRGSHHLADDFMDDVMALVQEKYPRLLDRTMDARYSILFEYTAPSNRIVLEYDQASLTALGMMDLSSELPELVSSPKLVLQLEEDYGTPAVKFHNLGTSVNSIIETVRTWKGSEGIVVWCVLPNGSLHFTKIKASEYIRIHSLKFHLTRDKIIMFCYTKGIETLEALQDEMHELGVDWEAVNFIQPHFEEYIERKARIEAEVTQFIRDIEEQEVTELPTRKEKAITLQRLTVGNRGLFNIGIQYVLGDKSVVKPGMDALILGVSMKRLDNYKALAKELTSSLSENTNENKENGNVYDNN
jgi:T4 RnlA family RNA ligase